MIHSSVPARPPTTLARQKPGTFRWATIPEETPRAIMITAGIATLGVAIPPFSNLPIIIPRFRGRDNLI
jgi:hypothetical protein